MAGSTVTLTVSTTCHFWFSPKAIEDVNGLGVTTPDIVHGWSDGTPDTPSVISVILDDGYEWDVHLSFRNAPPVDFEGLAPGAGGDLLTLLSAQGWTQV